MRQVQPSHVQAGSPAVEDASSALQNGISLSVRRPQSGSVVAQNQAVTHRKTESALFLYRKPTSSAGLPEGWFDEEDLD